MASERGPVPDEFEARRAAPGSAGSFAEAATLGEGLRAARETSGRSLAELSTATRVPVRYLTALEQNDFSVLPNRVFSIGYVRAYATALGVDEQEAVEAFKRESPDPSVPLQAPVGIAFEDVRRNSPRILAGLAVVVLAVVGWNVFQRVNLAKAPQPSDITVVPATWAKEPVETTIRLTPAQPAPPDQTTPKLYVTPGLEAALTGVDPATMGGAQIAPEGPVRRAFNPRGALYGAPASASQVVIQARKPASLVVRMGNGQVLFARQLAEGDAWRAPMDAPATIDVSDPTAFDVYLNGEHSDDLAGLLTPLASLNARAGAQARAAAEQADIARRAEEARGAAAAAASAPAPTPAPPAV
ncbi:helix-turn-helix domain-containing protein [Brevundimonas sp. NPDC092305]|uniref:helix-turn-helix domain-containing protein n=1 Tax=Brevundimonas sp. NPDC092305 TaxID=3363957 RepID=UPI00382476EE